MEGAVGSRHLKEDKSVVVMNLPKLHSQQTVVRLGDQEHSEVVLSTWHTPEKVVKDTLSGQEIVHLTSTCQPVFPNMTIIHLHPKTVIGKPGSVSFLLENMFNTTLQQRAHLLWKYTPLDSEQVQTNDEREAISTIHIELGVVDGITMEKSSQSELAFQLTALAPGQLVITGAEYRLKAMIPDKEPTDHEIRGKQVSEMMH